MEMNAEIIVLMLKIALAIFSTVMTVIGWLLRSVVVEMRRMSSAIGDLGADTKLQARVQDITNDGMLENRKHIGELFEKADNHGGDIKAIKAVCSNQHRTGKGK